SVSWAGIQCTLRALVIWRGKAVNTFFQLSTSWPEVHAMQLSSINIRLSNNISHFGTRTNMRHLVSRFIWNHYQEVMESVHRLSSELSFLKAALNITDDDFPWFIAEEHLYLSSLKESLAQDIQKVHYVQVLDDLKEKRLEWNSACDGANAALSGIIEGDFSTMAAAINQARVQVELVYMKLQNTEALAVHIQGQLGLESPWKVGCEEYNCYREEAMLGKYHKVLGELEQSVVMRLFELSKLTMLGTKCMWAKPAVHEATTKFFKLCHTKEEIMRLNVEMCHL
ncbi:hypothetical protein BKA83DRAFT_4059157, partial [Pisolithus microcarpus]